MRTCPRPWPPPMMALRRAACRAASGVQRLPGAIGRRRGGKGAAVTAAADRVAINPLQWMATDDGWLDPALAPPLERRLPAIRDAGIRGVQADLPPGISPAQFARALAAHGLVPAPGYISLVLPETAAAREPERERVARL